MHEYVLCLPISRQLRYTRNWGNNQYVIQNFFCPVNFPRRDARINYMHTHTYTQTHHEFTFTTRYKITKIRPYWKLNVYLRKTAFQSWMDAGKFAHPTNCMIRWVMELVLSCRNQLLIKFLIAIFCDVSEFSVPRSCLSAGARDVFAPSISN